MEIKNVAITAVIVMCSSVAYYFMIALPNQNDARISLEKQKFEMEKQEIDLERIEKKLKKLRKYMNRIKESFSFLIVGQQLKQKETAI